MKWIGQHIWSLISRFRSDVYLEDVDAGTIASGGNLGLDSNNKIVKATVSSGSGDIEGVTAGTGLSGGGTTGTVTLNVSGLTVSEIAAGSILVAGETFADNDTSLMSAAAINDRIESFGYTTNTGDITGVLAGSNMSGGGGSGNVTLNVGTASDSVKGVVQLATTAETTTGTDHGKAVTPDGLKDGYEGSTNVTTLGTIGTGEWRGSPVNGTYIGDDTIDSQHYADGSIDTAHIADAQVTVAKLHADAIQTSGETFADNDTSLMTSAAIDDRINTGDAAIASDTLTLTNKTFDANGTGNSLSNVEVADLAAAAIQTSGESFADNDTSLMTSAAIDDQINTKYSTSYITFSVKTNTTHGTNYILMHGNGISGGLVSIDSGVDSATDFGDVTAEKGGGSTETCSVATANLEQQIPIPETCKLMGFYATTTTTSPNTAAHDTGVAIWHMPESEVNWGGSTAGTATLIHKSDSSRAGMSGEGSNRRKVQKVERMDGTLMPLVAGDIIIPSVFGETADQQITATITLVIATPIKTIA